MTCDSKESSPYLKGQCHIFSLIVDMLNLSIRFQAVILLPGFAKAWKVLENEEQSWKVLENKICLERVMETGQMSWKVLELEFF